MLWYVVLPVGIWPPRLLIQCAATTPRYLPQVTTRALVMGAENASRWHVVGVIVLYWAVSISLVYLNKYIISSNSNVSVPIFVTWSQVR